MKMSRQTDFAEIKRLKRRNRTLSQDANFWHKRVNEAAEVVKNYEELEAENTQIRKLLRYFFNLPSNGISDRDEHLNNIALAEQFLKEKQ